ncbi:DNA replication/repair protein RecF [Leucobacter sp. OH1287]|uniref:DNA replication/repair protein RecF n=1 Tax=Leucobacter sp. OH1287 TaxID=2491049 RepID=UPI000F5DB611|nr:DNA replication/repair protein RecF [Leucobacter sp. OH1287]RRD60355.1 DNA replication/repair protein RecF [Leucobacter sp. OH1287]
MRVTKLVLRNWRNYQEATISLGAGPQLFLGRNGQGKTNIIEAIGYFNSLSSHRVASDGPLMRVGDTNTVVRMRVLSGTREVSLELEFNQGRPKRAQINGNRVQPRELTRWFTSVLFAPEDLAIVKGDPATRRAFLDEAIVTRVPAFAATLRDYAQVVKQRSALLKNARANSYGSLSGSNLAMLDVWDEQLTDFGTRIMAERRRLISDLMPYLRDSYQNLVNNDHRPELMLAETGSLLQPGFTPETFVAGESDTNFDHLSNVSRETLMKDFTEALKQRRSEEFDRGMTLVGSHRDELFIGLNSLPVKGYASHGESWSMALALKLAFANLVRDESTTGDPVLILDDVFAELDGERRSRLLAAVGDYEQIIVTAAVAADVPNNQHWNTTEISHGRVVSPENSGEEGEL